MSCCSHKKTSCYAGKNPANDALKHWRWQRMSAVALVFLLSWFVINLVSNLLSASPESLSQWLANPLVAVLMAVLIIAAYIHKHIGTHEILTDYLHCPTKKTLSNLLLDIACLALALGSLAAIWKLHHAGITIGTAL